MNKATHYNEITDSYYLLKSGVVFLWNKTWITSAFKENQLVEKYGFKKI